MLTFTENSVFQQLNGVEKNWPVAELLECYDPLPGEPLQVRNEAMKRVVEMAVEHFDSLSEAALLRYHFWKQLRPGRIEARKYAYSVKISDTYRWELTVNSEGLFYKDLNPMYGQMPGQVFEQLFSDFWFYGPMMPLPNLDDRKWAVAQIRNAFMQIGPVSQKHFQLFEYPKLPIDRFWEEGDHNSQDFVNLRYFGLENGRTNWHDGLVYLSFISFERLMADPLALEKVITPAIRAEVFEHLSAKDNVPKREEPDPAKARMKEIYLSNGGMKHYIYREHGDSYSASPIDEMIWKRELLDEMTQRLHTIDHYSGFHFIAVVMRYHGVPNIEELFVAAAKRANPKARQAIGQVVGELFDSEKGVEILLSLLEFEAQDSYWRDYVFNAFFRMRHNRAAQRWIRQCLEGNHEIYFGKAVGVLQMWGAFGEATLADRECFRHLNWQEKLTGTDGFYRCLQQVLEIISKP